MIQILPKINLREVSLKGESNMYKQVAHQLFWISFAVVSGFLFFNAISYDAVQVKILQKIEKIDLSLRKPQISAKAKQVLAGHKIYLINVLSKRAGLYDCQALKNAVPTLQSGMYMTYQQPGSEMFDMVFCDVTQQKQLLLAPQVSFVESQPLDIPSYASPILQQNLSSKIVNCESRHYEMKVCNQSHVIANMPIVKRKYSNSSCQSGVDFGFQGTELWVKNGCRADFELQALVSSTVSHKPQVATKPKITTEKRSGSDR
jgi:hypothetical protein